MGHFAVAVRVKAATHAALRVSHALFRGKLTAGVAPNMRSQASDSIIQNTSFVKFREGIFTVSGDFRRKCGPPACSPRLLRGRYPHAEVALYRCFDGS